MSWLLVVLSVFVLTVAMLGVFLLAYPYWLEYSAKQTHVPPEVEQAVGPPATGELPLGRRLPAPVGR